MTADTVTYRSPDKSQAVYLRAEARAALRIWINTYQARLHAAGMRQKAPKPLDTASYIAYSATNSALAQFAATDAASTALEGIGRLSQVEFEAAQRLWAEHERLDPQSKIVLVYDDSDMCRHGVSLDADCTACDA